VRALDSSRRAALEPDIPVPFGIEVFRAGRNPVLKTALEQEIADLEHPVPPGEELERYAGRYLKDETLVLDLREDEGILKAELTDFLPINRQRFLSDLHWKTGGRFVTHIKDVSLSFPARPASVPPRAILSWMGEDLVFQRTETKSVLAFELFSRGEVAEACARIRAEKDTHGRIYPDLEQKLNRLGYQYLRGGKTLPALQVVHLNLELFPECYNVYDSYGEALMVDGKIDSAIASYKRSLELNPQNANAARVIERLRSLQRE